MSFVPSEVRLTHECLKWDREWIYHRLPPSEITFPRELEPDSEIDVLPGSGGQKNQDQPTDPNLQWIETGIDQIRMDSAAPPTNSMGNEQSSSTNQTTTSNSFSFLTRASTRRSKGIVTVRDGNLPQESIEDDPIYQKFMTIPKFLPLMPSALGRRDQPTAQTNVKMSPRPFYKLAVCYQDYLHNSAKTVASAQNKIPIAIQKVDASVHKLFRSVVDRKENLSTFTASLESISTLSDDVLRIKLMLEELVPIAMTLNEILLPEDRLPTLNLGSVLIRTAVPSSDSSSCQSTPTHQLAAPIAPIDEIRVTDVSRNE